MKYLQWVISEREQLQHDIICICESNEISDKVMTMLCEAVISHWPLAEHHHDQDILVL